MGPASRQIGQAGRGKGYSLTARPPFAPNFAILARGTCIRPSGSLQLLNKSALVVALANRGGAWRRRQVLPRLMIAMVLALAGCTEDVRDLRLETVDLSDMRAVHELARQLSPTDKAALITYAAIHAPSSPGFCGKSFVGRSGRAPSTIGEAIELTLDLQADIRTARVEAERRKTRAQLAAEQWDGLIIQRELLISRQSALLSEHGAAARGLPEWRALQSGMSEYDKKLAALKPNFGTSEAS
jgi:hypothetical protein